MKILRHLWQPALSFLLGWLVVSLVVGGGAPEPEAVERERRPVVRTRATQTSWAGVNPAAVVESFRHRPVGDWSAIWDEFAERAEKEDFEKLIRLSDDSVGVGLRRDARNLPRLLAQEELAVRAEGPLPPVPGAYAALAEVDPAAAWQAWEQSGRKDLAIAVLRTMAGRDPQGAMEKCRVMPEPWRRAWGYAHDPGEGGINANSALGAVFAAWVRSDPESAIAASRSLAPHERIAVASDMAESLAFRDGAKAISFMLPFVAASARGSFNEGGWAKVLRASFRKDPAETARMMAEEPAVRRMMDFGRAQRFVLKPWLDADPAEVLDWVMEEESKREKRSSAVFGLVRTDRESASSYLRDLVTAGGQVLLGRHLRFLSISDPGQAEELAREFGIDEDGLRPTARYLPSVDPAAACDRWLAQLDQDGDPEQALEALGWRPRELTRLAAIARRSFPERAAKMAQWLPAPEPVTPQREERSGDATETRRTCPQSWFALDPAAAAAAWSGQSADGWEIDRAIRALAPYDPEAAAEWLAHLPEGKAKRQGERKLLSQRAMKDPEGVLEELLGSATFQAGTSPVSVDACLRQIQTRGGDWKAWLDRLPEVYRNGYTEYSLGRGEHLLEKLREGVR